MRKRLLSAIVAVSAGTGAALGQSPAPPPPAPIGTIGSYGGVIPSALVDPIAPPIGGPGMGMPGGPGGFPGGPMGPGGPIGPMGPGMGMDPSAGPLPYPPPGGYGQQMWEAPDLRGSAGVNARMAPKFWTNFDYLLWFAQAQPTSFPFVTSGPPAAGGIPGSVGTTTLHSNSDLGYNLINGFRITTGWFRDDARRYGWYGSGFLLEQKANVFFAQSDASGQGLLARPFIDATTGGPNALYASFPTFVSGNILIYSSNQTWGAEGGPIVNLFRSSPDDGGCLWDVNLMTAFRFLQIREMVRMQQFSSPILGSTLPFDGKLYGPPVQIEVNDEFNTTNRFYGGQLGLQSTLRYNRVSFGMTGKVAIGVMNQVVDVNGFSILRQPSSIGQSVAQGGLFANSTNIGRYNNDEFTVIPELNANLGYNWCSWLSTTIGYSFMYVNRVARPGDQFGATVNPAVVPVSPTYGLGGAVATPNPILTQSDFWLQGVSFGLNIRY